ncbi:CBS domain-containing protein [Actinospongicola halichondriae]|uniref:CBS domain-containing protein n=1 Tax=Actinospongicola halichondriae TaxID=3236844 RepID=UPI003D4B7E04
MLADQILDAKGREVATVAPDATVSDALAMLAQHNVGALVASADGSSVDGIISERDIVRRIAADGSSALDLAVRDLMKSEVATCDGRADTEKIMGVMTNGRFRHMPVVEDGALQGIISIGDVVKVRIDELATEKDQLVGYIRDGR